MINSTSNQTGMKGLCYLTSNITDTEIIPKVLHSAIGGILLMSTVCSVCANGLILYVILVQKGSFLKRLHLYIAVVCILALLMAVLGCPLVVFSSFAGHWLFGDGGCIYCGFVMTFCGLSTILILAMISVDRFAMVVYDAFRGPSSRRFYITGMSGCLIVSLILAILPLIGWNRYTYESIGTACAPDIQNDDVMSRTYLMTLLVTCFFIPLCTMVFCYWKLISKVKESRHRLRLGSQFNGHPVSKMTDRKLNLELQIVLTAIYIVGTFLLCWSPYAVIMILSVFYPDAMSPMASVIPSMITKIGGCFKPLVYFRRDRKIRKFLADMFPCLRPTRNPEENVSYRKDFFFITTGNCHLSMKDINTTLTNRRDIQLPITNTAAITNDI